jgi:hypothetical protein
MPTWGAPVTVCNGKNQLTYQKCTNWANNDANDCNRNAPAGTVAWQSCDIGSNPSAGICSAISPSFGCAWGQDCYAITTNTASAGCDPTTFSQPYTACDGNDQITYVACDNWFNNDPQSCFNSLKAPANVVDWKKCALGSSPGGLVPGKGATACPLPASTTFNCVGGQECFAVINRIANDPGCVQSNPVNQITSLLNNLNPLNWLQSLGWYAGLISAVILLCCLCFVGFLLYTMVKGSGGGAGTAASATGAASAASAVGAASASIPDIDFS